MSDKERNRLIWLEMVAQGKVRLTKVAKQLGISYRQAKRIYRRYKAQGDIGLLHRSRGVKSNREHPLRSKAIECYKAKYRGFGPTLAAEKLSDEEVIVDHESLRRWLIKECLWSKERTRNPYRKKRDRREQFNELV